jgi:hypothetical protein
MTLLDRERSFDEEDRKRDEVESRGIEDNDSLKLIYEELKKLNTYLHIITGEKL